MKLSRLFPLLSLLLLVSTLSAAQTQNETQALTAPAFLSKASQLTDLRARGGAPFRLRLQFRLWHDSSRSTEGTYMLLWMAPDRFVEDTNSSIFTNVDLVMGNKLWRRRSLDYLPLRLWQFQILLNVSGRLKFDPTAIKKMKIHSGEKNGIKSTCTESNTEWEKRKTCFDGTVPIKIESSIPTETQRFEYLNYATVGTRSFPRELRYYINDRLVVEAKVEEFTADISEEPALFTPPTGAAEKLWCADMVGGNFVPGSFTPPHLKGISSAGAVTVYALIQPDGATQNLKIIETFRPDFDKVVQKAVESARFEPAVCNGTPTDKDFILRLTYKP